MNIITLGWNDQVPTNTKKLDFFFQTQKNLSALLPCTTRLPKRWLVSLCHSLLSKCVYYIIIYCYVGSCDRFSLLHTQKPDVFFPKPEVLKPYEIYTFIYLLWLVRQSHLPCTSICLAQAFALHTCALATSPIKLYFVYYLFSECIVVGSDLRASLGNPFSYGKTHYLVTLFLMERRITW